MQEKKRKKKKRRKKMPLRKRQSFELINIIVVIKSDTVDSNKKNKRGIFDVAV